MSVLYSEGLFIYLFIYSKTGQILGGHQIKFDTRIELFYDPSPLFWLCFSDTSIWNVIWWKRKNSYWTIWYSILKMHARLHCPFSPDTVLMEKTDL